MRRRKFFKSLSIGAAAAIVAPQVLAEKHPISMDVSAIPNTLRKYPLTVKECFTVDPCGDEFRFFINGKPYICNWSMYKAEQEWMEKHEAQMRLFF